LFSIHLSPRISHNNVAIHLLCYLRIRIFLVNFTTAWHLSFAHPSIHVFSAPLSCRRTPYLLGFAFLLGKYLENLSLRICPSQQLLVLHETCSLDSGANHGIDIDIRVRSIPHSTSRPHNLARLFKMHSHDSELWRTKSSPVCVTCESHALRC